MKKHAMKLEFFRLLAVVLMGSASVLNAATYTVASDGSKDFTTIYAAYTNSEAKGDAGVGDVIEVYNGTYTNYVGIGAPGRTIRAAAGQTPVWAARGACALQIQASNTVVEGLTFSGTNGVIDGIRLFHNDCRVTMNTFLDLTNSSGTYLYGIQCWGARNEIVSNRFSRLGTGVGAHAVAAYLVTGPDNRFEYNQIDTVNSGGSAGPLSINASYSWVRFNVISNVARQSGGQHKDCYGISVAQSSCVIEGNTIYGTHQWSAKTTYGINFGSEASAQRGTIVNNRLIQCGLGVEASNAAGTNNVVANNYFLGCSYGARPRNSSQNMYSNNVFAGAYYTFYTEAAYTASNNWLNGNCLLCYAGPHSGVGLGRPQYWSGNFYATGTAGNQTNGTALPPPVTLGLDTDASAVTGFWARAFLPANTAGIVVGNPNNRNDQNQATRLVYDTTPNPGMWDTNIVGGVLFDMHAMLHDTTNGLPAKRVVGLGRTLRVTHVFPDGTCMYSLRVAYNPRDLPFRNAEATVQLHRFNNQEYPNWYWQPAVEGNVVNDTFPANDVRSVEGPPDGVLGHYGVDTAQHLVWANLNYIGDFIVTQQTPPPGTVICIR